VNWGQGVNIKFCPLCKSDLVAREVGNIVRQVCSSPGCRFVHWNNPIPVVAGLVHCDGHYVLARNAEWPVGMFSLISGFLENGERPEDAIVRETKEELGLHGHHCRLIGHFALPMFNQIVVAYAVEAQGELNLSDEISEVLCISESDLASFDFGALALTRSIVDRWLGQVIATKTASPMLSLNAR